MPHFYLKTSSKFSTTIFLGVRRSVSAKAFPKVPKMFQPKKTPAKYISILSTQLCNFDFKVLFLYYEPRLFIFGIHCRSKTSTSVSDRQSFKWKTHQNMQKILSFLNLNFERKVGYSISFWIRSIAPWFIKTSFTYAAS